MLRFYSECLNSLNLSIYMGALQSPILCLFHQFSIECWLWVCFQCKQTSEFSHQNSWYLIQVYVAYEIIQKSDWFRHCWLKLYLDVFTSEKFSFMLETKSRPVRNLGVRKVVGFFSCDLSFRCLMWFLKWMIDEMVLCMWWSKIIFQFIWWEKRRRDRTKTSYGHCAVNWAFILGQEFSWILIGTTHTSKIPPKNNIDSVSYYSLIKFWSDFD